MLINLIFLGQCKNGGQTLINEYSITMSVLYCLLFILQVYLRRKIRSDVNEVKSKKMVVEVKNVLLDHDNHTDVENGTEEGEEQAIDDKESMLAAVAHDGFALRHASKELKNDKEIVMAAVTQNGHALRYASDELKNDKEIVVAAVASRERESEEAAKTQASREASRERERLKQVFQKHQEEDCELFIDTQAKAILFNFIVCILTGWSGYILRKEVTSVKK